MAHATRRHCESRQLIEGRGGESCTQDDLHDTAERVDVGCVRQPPVADPLRGRVRGCAVVACSTGRELRFPPLLAHPLTQCMEAMGPASPVSTAVCSSDRILRGSSQLVSPVESGVEAGQPPRPTHALRFV